jgi:hypothetical protein
MNCCLLFAVCGRCLRWYYNIFFQVHLHIVVLTHCVQLGKYHNWFVNSIFCLILVMAPRSMYGQPVLFSMYVWLWFVQINYAYILGVTLWISTIPKVSLFLLGSTTSLFDSPYLQFTWQSGRIVRIDPTRTIHISDTVLGSNIVGGQESDSGHAAIARRWSIFGCASARWSLD